MRKLNDRANRQKKKPISVSISSSYFLAITAAGINYRLERIQRQCVCKLFPVGPMDSKTKAFDYTYELCILNLCLCVSVDF